MNMDRLLPDIIRDSSPPDDKSAKMMEKLSVENINLNDSKSSVGRVNQTPGSLLHHCLPITSLKLLDGIVLVGSEGPSVLMKMAYFDKQQFTRYQIFPNEYIISGMEFTSGPILECGDHVYVGFIWAGSRGTVVRIKRSPQGCLKLSNNESENSISLDFIPVAAKWLDEGKTLALLSVLNYVVLYGWVESEQCLKEFARIKCEKSETLFSGTIYGSSKNSIRIFAGTVFNGICVWDINENQSEIRHELKCHDGIVFSLEYYKERNIFLSTSDDRTVAVWQFSGTKDNEQATLLHRFYGHDARVWRALLVHDYVVSVGESSDVRVNNLKGGEEHKSWKAHDGAPIFTSVYDEDVDVFYTGGADGSIRKWPKWWYRLKPRILPFDTIPYDPQNDDKNQIQGSGRWAGNKDFPKQVILLDINHILCSMESGRVIGISWEGTQFDLLHDSQCEGYQIIKMSPDHKILAVAGKDGHIYTAEICFSQNESSKTNVLYARKLFMTKVSWHILSMTWLDASRLLIICCNRAVALLFQENEKGERSEAKHIQTFNLNLQRPGVPAALEIFGKYVILGDELGTLHLFRYHKTNEAILKFENAHKDGVTALLFHDLKLYSAGRDGLVKTFSIQINKENDLEAELVPLNEFFMPFDWISGIYVNMDQILICGFQRKDFVVRSFNEKRTLAKIPCDGGGNRKWDFKYGHGLEGSVNASFSFVKDKEVFYTFLPMTAYLNVIMKEGMHSKTINCAFQLPQESDVDSDENMISYITGSEDGSLRWFQWDRTNEKILTIENMENHVSSIRSINACKMFSDVSNHIFIFTGGGKSQLCIYLLDYGSRKVNLLKEIILVKTSFKQTEGDVRIMDIAVIEQANNEILVFGACSDGYVRILYFNAQTHKFKITATLKGNDHAVMKIQLLLGTVLKNELLICGITSNGYFIIWRWNTNECSKKLYNLESSKTVMSEYSPDYTTLLRRTAFLSMQANLITQTDNEYSIVCGGDDCSVSCWWLKIVETNGTVSYIIAENWITDQSQRGAVVGVCQANDKIYTVSNDQIIGLWNQNNGDLEHTFYAGVSDCQGFVMDKVNKLSFCFGKGMSWVFTG